MDATALANTLMGILTPLMPYLGAAGSAIATDIGDTIYKKAREQGKRLFETIRDRFAKEKDGGSATQALQTFVNGDADYSIVVKTKLERMIRDDPDFANNLLQIIHSGPLQSLIVGDKAKARDIDMANSLGIGTQEIQTGRGSETEGIRMNINTGDM